jgi:hypothetical protein
MKKTMLAIALGTAPLFAFAAGDSGSRTLTNVHVEGGSFVAVKAATAWNNPDGCTYPAGNIVGFYVSDATEKEKFSLVLTAIASGKSVGFWLDGCIATPWGGTIPRSVTADIFN